MNHDEYSAACLVSSCDLPQRLLARSAVLSVVASTGGELTLPFPISWYRQWQEYSLDAHISVTQALHVLQVSCFLRDEEAITGASQTVAAEIRQSFRNAVRAELQLSLAALPWPASVHRGSSVTCQWLQDLPAEAAEAVLQHLHPVECIQLPVDMRLARLASLCSAGALDLRGLLSRCPDLSRLPQRDQDCVTNLSLDLLPASCSPSSPTTAGHTPSHLLTNLSPTTLLTLVDTDLTSDALHLLKPILHALSQPPNRLHTAVISPADAALPPPSLTARQRSRTCGHFLSALPCMHLRHLTLDLPPHLQPHLACVDTWAPPLACMRALTHLRLSLSSTAPRSRPPSHPGRSTRPPTADHTSQFYRCISPATMPNLQHLSLFITHATYLHGFFAQHAQHTRLRSLELSCCPTSGHSSSRSTRTQRFLRGAREFRYSSGQLPLCRAMHAAAFAAMPQLTHVAFATQYDAVVAAPPSDCGRHKWLPLPLLLPDGVLGDLEPCCAQVTACELQLADMTASVSRIAPGDVTNGAGAACRPARHAGAVVGVSVGLPPHQLPLLARLSALTRLHLQLLPGEAAGADGHEAPELAHAGSMLRAVHAAADQQGGHGARREPTSRGAHRGSPRDGGRAEEERAEEGGREGGSSDNAGSMADEDSGASSPLSMNEALPLQDWACSPHLLSLTCFFDHHLPSTFAVSAARHAASLTALTALSWRSIRAGSTALTEPNVSDTAAFGTCHAASAAPDPAGVGALAVGLWEMRSLRSMTVDAPEATPEAATQLAAALGACTRLTQLTLHMRSLEALTARSAASGSPGLRRIGLVGPSAHAYGACEPLPALAELQSLTLRACGNAPAGARPGSAWEVQPRCANDLVAGLAAIPQLSRVCISEIGCSGDVAAGAVTGQGRGPRGLGGPASRLSQHYSRLRALRELSLEFDFCFVAALAPQLEALRRLQRLEVAAGASDGRRDVLRRLWRSTAKLPLRRGVRLRTDMPET
eukprot:jgi/Ulvmu1/2854/UM145_0009.1